MKLSRLRKLRIKAMRGELTTKADTALPIQSIEQERASYALGKVKDFVEGVTITDAKKKEWKINFLLFQFLLTYLVPAFILVM